MLSYDHLSFLSVGGNIAFTDDDDHDEADDDSNFAVVRRAGRAGGQAEVVGERGAEAEADCERDYFMSADEAMAYGLIDKVIYKR